MEISLKMLTRIVNGVKLSSSRDNKIYINDKDTMIFLAKIGGQVVSNGLQFGGRWITGIKIGCVEFIHSSKERIIT